VYLCILNTRSFSFSRYITFNCYDLEGRGSIEHHHNAEVEFIVQSFKR